MRIGGFRIIKTEVYLILRGTSRFDPTHLNEYNMAVGRAGETAYLMNVVVLAAMNKSSEIIPVLHVCSRIQEVQSA